MQNPTRRQYLKGLVALGDAAAGAAAGLDGLSAEERTATRTRTGRTSTASSCRTLKDIATWRPTSLSMQPATRCQVDEDQSCFQRLRSL